MRWSAILCAAIGHDLQPQTEPPDDFQRAERIRLRCPRCEYVTAWMDLTPMRQSIQAAARDAVRAYIEEGTEPEDCDDGQRH